MFVDKLDIPFSDSIASVFANKLDTDGWAALNDSVEFPGLLLSSIISVGFAIGASGNKLRIELPELQDVATSGCSSSSHF